MSEQQLTEQAALDGALARVEAFLRGWAPYRGGVALASKSGEHLFLRDVRTLIDAAKEARHLSTNLDPESRSERRPGHV